MMTEIYVNNQKIDDEINQNAKVDDLLELLFNKYADQSKVISLVEYDDFAIDENENEVLASEVGSFKKLNFEILSKIDLAFDALNNCSLHVDLLCENIEELVISFRENDLKKSEAHFIEIIDSLDKFIQLVAMCYSVIKNSIKEADEVYTAFHDLEIHMLNIFKCIIDAKEKNDVIMLCDLLEYELIDNLTQWKNKMIPQLKNLKTN